MRNIAIKAVAWRDARPVKLESLRKEEGQTVIEYALVVAAVSIVLIAALLTFGNAAVSKAQAKLTALIV